MSLEFVAVLNLITTIVLAVLTGIYVVLTRSLALTAKKQALLSSNPVVVIKIKKLWFSEKFGPDRQNFDASVELINLGNGPAINISLDGSVELSHISHKGQKSIPPRFVPEFLPFLKIGESSESNSVSLNFGNDCCDALVGDLRETERLNIIRIRSADPHEKIASPGLNISCYYKNNLEQWFRTDLRICLGHWHKNGGWSLPESFENVELQQFYDPRPIFDARVTSKQEIDAEIEQRNKSRHLSGW